MPQDRRPFTAEDLYLHKKITDTACSPNAAACVVKSINRDADAYESHLWLFPLDGSPGRQLTHGPASDTSPRWSPDGRRLAFLSTRGGGPPQIHVVEPAGGEPRAVCKLPQGAVDIAWSPDGRLLFATAPVMVDPDLHGKLGTGAPTQGKSTTHIGGGRARGDAQSDASGDARTMGGGVGVDADESVAG